MTEVITSLDLLKEPFRSKARGLLADLTERRTFFVVTETLRTYGRQELLVKEGKSRTMRSNHLVGKAMDVAPVTLFEEEEVKSLTWDKNFPAWRVLKILAEKWDIEWGGNWQGFPDFPHLEDK